MAIANTEMKITVVVDATEAIAHLRRIAETANALADALKDGTKVADQGST